MTIHPLIFLLTVQICFYYKRRIIWHRLKHVVPECAQCKLDENRTAESIDPSKIVISWSIWPSTSRLMLCFIHPILCVSVSFLHKMYLQCQQKYSRVDSRFFN
ncbi:histone-lysine N-methyltransferase ASHR3-like [Hordeum vulgare]|nr:histone-lysine N-methyltransferase ASHR3-like [Hordeum vulgare]